MVSALDSVRLVTSQAMLKALKETEAEAAAESQQAVSGILRQYGIETGGTGASGTQSLSALLTELGTRGAAGSTATGAATTGVVSTDIATASFMTGLSDRIAALAEAPETAQQSDGIAAALKAGTLTVTDPLTGRAVTAFDPADQETGSVSEVGTSGWSDFLKSHLKRGEDGAFVRAADGSYVDATSGANAWFGMVGSTYVYLTWPAKTAGA